MAYADDIFKHNLANILFSGESDNEHEVRPVWEDGTSAHTRYTTMVSNIYNIEKYGFPINTLRPLAWKTAIKEILWMWVDKSNDVNLLEEKYGVMYWREWANKEGNLGKSYAYQLSKIIDFPEGRFDQVDRLLYLLKHNPMNRRIRTEMLNLEEMVDMTLPPCAHATDWAVRGDYLDMRLDQRSQDFISANGINVFQYSVLLAMVAQVSGLKVGKLKHDITNMHIYDRHMDYANDLMQRDGYKQPKLWINPKITNFYDFTIDDFQIIDYQTGKQIRNIPIAV